MSADDLMNRIEQARNSLDSARQLVSEAQEILGIRDEPPPQEPEERGFFDKAWDAIGDHAHTGLDLAGFLPVVGTAADLVNAGLYAAEGDYVNAGLSATSAVPVVGDAAAAVRLGVRSVDAAADTARNADNAADAANLVRRDDGGGGGGGGGNGGGGGGGGEGGSGGGGSDWPELSGMLQDAARGKGNFGVGSATREQAEAVGHAWVGSNPRVASDGKTLLSADGLRQYRPPSWKPNLGRTQANLEWREPGQTGWHGNGHIDITD